MRQHTAANKTQIIVATAFITIGSTGTPQFAAEFTRQVIVHVDNYAPDSRVYLSGAEDEASRIFTAAGVHLVWVPGGDATDPRSIDLRVIVLSGEMLKQKIANDGVGSETVGQASRATKRAYVFFPRILKKADQYEQPVETLLGPLIAHELGHLLLPEHSHSNTGIMRETFDRRTLVQRFTPAQALAIRQLLSVGTVGTVAAR